MDFSFKEDSQMRKLVLFLITALLLCGCGSNASSSAAPASSAEETQTLRVGMECNYAPFNWTTTTETETSQPISSTSYCDGYDVVIATRLAEGSGMNVQVVPYDWDGLIPALVNGEIDAIIAGMTPTEERMEVIDFTEPYYESEEVIVVRGDSELTSITSISELSGFTIKGQLSTIYDEVIDQAEGAVHGTPLDNVPALINDLQHGGCDAVVVELPVANGIVSANPDLAVVRFAEGSGFSADTRVSVGIAKGNSELLNALQNVLNGISESERQELMAAAIERQPAGE